MRRRTIDRRQDERRKGYDIEFMDRLAIERRKSERRVSAEKRQDWVRVDRWSSVQVLPVHRVEVDL